jgi:hypothetical protein
MVGLATDHTLCVAHQFGDRDLDDATALLKDAALRHVHRSSLLRPNSARSSSAWYARTGRRTS